jgi:DNA-binding NarL/FixJ family response regulator
MATTVIKVLLVDDHPLITEALRTTLVRPRFEVVGTAKNITEAEKLIATQQPAIVICDIALETSTDGLDLLRKYTQRRTPLFIMLSSFYFPSLIRSAFEAGAMGYVLKTTELEKLQEVVIAISEGQTYFSSSMLNLVRSAYKMPSAAELKILKLLVKGDTNATIAVELCLSENTVESHLRRLFGRYEVFNRGELVAKAQTEGWI